MFYMFTVKNLRQLQSVRFISFYFILLPSLLSSSKTSLLAAHLLTAMMDDTEQLAVICCHFDSIEVLWLFRSPILHAVAYS